MQQSKTSRSESRIYFLESKNLIPLLIKLNSLLEKSCSKTFALLRGGRQVDYYPENFMTLKEDYVREDLGEYNCLNALKNKPIEHILLIDTVGFSKYTDILNNVVDVLMDTFDPLKGVIEKSLFASIIVGGQKESIIKTYSLEEMVTNPSPIYNLFESYCFKVN